MKPLSIAVVGALLMLCNACYGQKPDSAVEKWWYTEVPQGYTEQGTATMPTTVGSPLPTISGSNTGSASNSSNNNNNKR